MTDTRHAEAQSSTSSGPAAGTIAPVHAVAAGARPLPFGWAGDDEAAGLGDADDPAPGGVLSSADLSATGS
jgi:hypothetical protein